MTTKRVFELRYADVFTYFGRQRIVVKIENGFIYYNYYELKERKGSNLKAIGWKSKEIVEYHFNEYTNVNERRNNTHQKQSCEYSCEGTGETIKEG